MFCFATIDRLINHRWWYCCYNRDVQRAHAFIPIVVEKSCTSNYIILLFAIQYHSYRVVICMDSHSEGLNCQQILLDSQYMLMLTLKT